MQLVAIVARVTTGKSNLRGGRKCRVARLWLCVCVFMADARAHACVAVSVETSLSEVKLLSSYQSCVSMLCGVTPTGVTCYLH